jgi:hypothetical protein
MNYFGHVALACRFSSSPEFLLGSMLPDLASIIAYTTPHCTLPAVQLGVRFHLLTDEEFHQTATFRSLVGACREELELAGMRRAPARAASHVAIELLLDAELSNVPLHGIAFRTALRIAGQSGTRYQLQWTTDDAAEKFESLRLRLVERNTCGDFFANDRLVERLVFALQRRPRLRMSPHEQNIMRQWVHGRAAPLGSALAALWIRLHERISVRWRPSPQPDLIQPICFSTTSREAVEVISDDAEE